MLYSTLFGVSCRDNGILAMCFLFDGKVCNTSAPKMKKTPTPAGTCWALLFSKALKPARDTELPRSADLGREQATENSVACSGWRVPGCAKGQTRGVLQQMSCGSPQTIQCDDDAIKCHLLYRCHMPNCNSSYIYIFIAVRIWVYNIYHVQHHITMTKEFLISSFTP